ncbi:MAG: type III-B CRISPR-associated protein Cas10/Cmr2 [Anaerolinea sp.]|nr:type III-B CRISPR-associated protein Cas10/Cmr2 [Anaerolinea sp.]
MEPVELTLWSSLVLPLVLNQEPPPATLPGGGLALLSADTDRTQEFVFQSARLPEIRGASMHLDELNRDKLLAILTAKGLLTGFIAPLDEKDEKGCVVYAGGGSLLALVPLNLAEELCREIEALYPRKTDIATITAVTLPITIAQARGLHAPISQPTGLTAADQKRFAAGVHETAVQQLMAQQALALRYRKHAKTSLPHVETDPHARQCQSCGRRPASDVYTFANEPTRYFCRVCGENGRIGRANKSWWNEQFVDWAEKNHRVRLIAPKANDLHEIGKVSNGYIGYIYADGNGIGKLLEVSDSLAAYSRLSQKLDDATLTAVYSALFQNLYQPQTGDVLPFEIITIGGDDVLLIVPAHTALPVARDICAGFGAQMADLAVDKQPPPSMSAGVVIAQDSNPIYFIHDLARQLLQNAKKNARQPGAHLDFMALKSQSTLATSLRDVRKSPYLQVNHKLINERCLLTARPYALADLDKLLRHTAALKNVSFAPGQLHQMRREFQNGRFPAIFYYLYQRTRLSSEQRHTLRQIETDWGMVEPDGAPPWIALPGPAADGFQEFTTPWLDMLDLREFVA